MSWKLWRLTALLTVLLAVTGAAVDIRIIGGSEVYIGGKAEIQCSYTHFPLYLPNFIINGVTIDSTNLKTQLMDYNQKHDPTCTDGCSATYTLTLLNVSWGYNGTTYQCYVGQDGSVKSGIVTLVVRDHATGGTTAAKESTAGTGPPQTSSTTAPPPVSNMHATTAIVMTTTQKLGALDASKTVPHEDTDTALDSTSLTRSNIQLVYTTAIPRPLTTHVTMATKAPTQIIKNSMMTSVTTTSTVTLTEKSSKIAINVISSEPTSTVTPMVSSSTTSLGASVTQTTQPTPTTEVVGGGKEATDAPSYINVVVGSVTAVTVYLLTIMLIGLAIHFGVKAKKNRSKGNRFPTLPPIPPPPPAQVIEMTHNPVYEGNPAPPAYEEHIDFGGNRDVLVNMDVRYHDVPGRKSVAVESLYDYVQ